MWWKRQLFRRRKTNQKLLSHCNKFSIETIRSQTFQCLTKNTLLCTICGHSRKLPSPLKVTSVLARCLKSAYHSNMCTLCNFSHMQCDNVFVIDMILISKHLMFFKELFNKTEGRKKTTKTNRAANPQVLYECYIQIVCNLWELLADEMLGLFCRLYKSKYQ